MRIFKSSLTKKILGILLIVWCSGVFLNGYVGMAEPVHAQTTGTDQWVQDNSNVNSGGFSSMGLWETLNLILKLIYLLLRPLLVVAGLSLDNTLVYGSIFHLDVPLRKFRNMIKNFANFTLGFMVLFAIIKWFFTQKDEKWPIDIIKKTLIAGILIQASWFLMAALIDVSTIATYAVGGLPLSILKNTSIGNQKILTVNSSLDLNKFDVLNKNSEGFKVRYSTTYNDQQIRISPCRVKQSYVIGREFGDTDFRNKEKFAGTEYKDLEVCILFGNQLVMRDEDAFMTKLEEKYKTVNNVTTAPDRKTPPGDVAYNKMMTFLTNTTGWAWGTWLATGNLVNLKKGQTQAWFESWSAFFADSTSMTLSDLINKSKGFVGPLVTMYSSLLNFAQLTDTNVTTLGETSGIFLIKTGIAIALFFPLIALAIVLIARIGMLWLYIAASPFLVIKKVFGDTIPNLWSLDKTLDLNNVFKLIFAPVITVAALSISLIFMTALIKGFNSGDNTAMSSEIAENLTIQPIKPQQEGNQAYRVAWSSELEFKNFDRWGTLDRLSWMVVNFFAIGLLRTILFAAIKANSLGDRIQKNVQTFGANVFQSIPIVPFGEWGKQRVGIGAALAGITQAPQRWASERINAQERAVAKLFEPKTPETTTTTRILTTTEAGGFVKTGATAETIKTGVTNLWVTETNVGTVLGASKESLFAAVNTAESDKTKREALATLLSTTAGVTNLPADRYTTMTKEEAIKTAKTPVDTYINTKKPTTVKELEWYFNTPTTKADKTTIEAYFTSWATEYQYPTAIDNKTYKITQKSDGKTPPTFTYTATEVTT